MINQNYYKMGKMMLQSTIATTRGISGLSSLSSMCRFMSTTTMSCSRRGQIERLPGSLSIPRSKHQFSSVTESSEKTAARTSATIHTSGTISSLNWNEFFAYRRSKKRYERLGTVLGSIIGFTVGGYYFFAVAEFDPTMQIFGLPDPTIVYVLGAVLVGIAGTVSGILFGGAFWRMVTKRDTLAQIDQMERTFFKRMAKHRPKEHRNIVNPATGTRNFAPDYYGEHIYSLSDYRQWIRKQRRFSAGILTSS